MARSLNPNLFGQQEVQTQAPDAGSQAALRKTRELEAQMDVLNQKIDKWAKILESKFQQMQSVQKNLGEQIRQVSENFSTQQAGIHSKLNERRSADVKVQELVDRHNQLIQSFEGRVSQMQRVASEQEMKLMSYQATYDEILREIRTIKHQR